MTADVTGDFAATGGVAHMNRVLQVELLSQHCKIVCVGVHIVAVPRLCGTAVPAPVVRDDSIAALAEEQHLSVPIVRGERPSVTEHDRLTATPVFVINLRTILCRDSWHNCSPHSSCDFLLASFRGLPRQCLDNRDVL